MRRRSSSPADRETNVARLSRELSEAFEQQAATAEILNVISNSPTDTQPVFNAIVQSGLKLFPGALVSVALRYGDMINAAAVAAADPARVEAWRRTISRTPLARNYMHGAALLDRRIVNIPDVADAPAEFVAGGQNFLTSGNRAITIMPMMRGDEAIGLLSVVRLVAGPLSDKQLAVLRTFANQAVIAIENTRLLNETKAALEQQTATAEILRVMSSSPSDVQPVFDAVARKTSELCSGNYAIVVRFDGKLIHLAAQHNARPGADQATAQRYPRRPGRETPASRAILERAVVHVPYADKDPELPQDFVRRIGAGSFLSVPLLCEGKAIGAIGASRAESGPFPDKQIELVKVFADQAVIAIENARLFNETKEALERQTATSEILRVISQSPTDTQPVFKTIVASAARLCDADFSAVVRFEGGLLHLVAVNNMSPAETAAYHSVFPRAPGRHFAMGRAFVDGRPAHIENIETDPDYDPWTREVLSRAAAYRTFLGVPILQNGLPIGAIGCGRHEMKPFTAPQIELVKTFADQAVIAIENVRLFKELQARTEALTKSLGQLTALGEVGQAISSTLDLETVLKTIVQRAVQLAGLDGGSIYEFDERDEGFHLRAAEHVDEEILEVSRKSPIRLGEGAVGRAGATREPVVVEDVLDESYQSRVRELLIRSGSRAVLAVPLLREDLLLGALSVTRKAPGPFAPEVIELLKTFATQSALAIQNARLFNETKQALKQQKATAEVLGVISGSIADTQPVFEKILDSCERLFEGHLVGITVVRPDGMIDRAAYRGPDEEEIRSIFPMPLSRDSASGNAILDAKVVHYPDIEAPGVPAGAARRFRMAGTRAIICAPMLFEGQGVGAIWVGRNFAAAFTDKHIALLRTFADQAAIAIQNAKLFREIQEKSKQLEVASQHKSQFLASMSHELRTPLNAILGFNEMLLDQVYGELSEDVKAPLENMQASGKHLLRLINNVLDLAKIEAGRMELALSDYSVQDTVESVRSTLRPLAESKGLELLATVPQDLPLGYGDPGRITQCLMNLAGNSLKFTKAGKVEIAVALKDSTLVYRVADTGIGIPSDKIDNLFTEFKQTDPTIASEYGGTGLGLSITKKFIEMHGGRIWVESEPGTGSTFTFEVPLRGGERKAA